MRTFFYNSSVYNKSQVLGVQSSTLGTWVICLASQPRGCNLSLVLGLSDRLVYYRKHFIHLAIFTASCHIVTIPYTEC